MKEQRVKRESYRQILKYIQEKIGVRHYPAKITLTELGKQLHLAVERGEDIDIPQIVRVGYYSKVADITTNRVYDFERQVVDVAYAIQKPESFVRKVLSVYYYRIKTLIESGYRVSIKGVILFLPQKRADGTIYAHTSLSPVMQTYKTDGAMYNVLGDNGLYGIRKVNREDLRYQITVSEELCEPNEIREPTLYHKQTIEG